MAKTLFVPETLKERLSALTERLMPSEGHAETIEGEMIRAINRILYRFYNDGDVWWDGYGCETAGPAQAFLVSHNIPKEISDEVKMALQDSEYCSQQKYEKALFRATESIVSYIEDLSHFTSNDENIDMYDFSSKHEYEQEEDYCGYCGCEGCYGECMDEDDDYDD